MSLKPRKPNPKKQWDLFYKRNSDHFFKDRHWILREFEAAFVNVGVTLEMAESLVEQRGIVDKKCKLLELGCGVGNLVLPMQHLPLELYAVDHSPVAIEILAKKQECIQTAVCDFSQPITTLFGTTFDIITSIFCLSAIETAYHKQYMINVFKILKPNGSFLFRDYGEGDQAQNRFKKENQYNKMYIRHDGTFSYFFSIPYMTNLIEQVAQELGLAVEKKIEYIHRTVVNRKQELEMQRVFLQMELRLL